MKVQSLLLLSGAFLFGLKAFAGGGSYIVIPSGTDNLEAVLGSAYQSEKENLVGQSCINGKTPVPAGKSEAGFTFGSSMTESQLSSELGLSVGAKARSGAVEYSGSASFLTQSMSDSLSVSSAWESDYTFPVDKLIVQSGDLNDTGKKFLNDPDRWAETCGDQYVAEVVRGAKLFFSIRVDFSSLQDKEEFQAKFSVSGPLAEANADLKQASAQFSRSTRVTIAAYQVGGDVSKVTGVFNQSDAGKTGFIQCSLGSFEQCANVIQNAIQYATDVKTGFPSQLSPGALPGPAVLAYRTAPYSSMGVHVENYPGLSAATKQGRQIVSDDFEKQFRYEVTGERLLQQKNLGDRIAAIQTEKDKADHNITQILAASQACYDTPNLCWAAAQDLRPVPVDASVFLPPSFEDLCGKSASTPELANTLTKLRAQMDSPPTESCKDFGVRLMQQETLDLSGSDDPNDALDLRMLATLTHLTHLTISGAKVDDVSALGDLINLKYLDLQNNRISNVEPLSDMMELIYLNLDHNVISRVDPLSSLSRLQRLFVVNNQISDLSSLKFFPQLLAIDLRLNPLTAKEVSDFRSRMPAGALVQYSQQTASSVDILTSRYESSVAIPDDDPSTGGDIQVTCMGVIFKEWSQAYLAILDHSDVVASDVGAPLDHFGHKWFDVEMNLNAAEYFRPGVNKAIQSAILKMHSEPQAPADLDPSQMTLADVLDSLYASNLALCAKQELITQVEPKVKKVDPNAEVPPGILQISKGTLSWSKTPSGGIKPVLNQPQSSALFADGFSGNSNSVAPITYREFIQQMKERN
jgi:hypothetical protein